MRAWLAVPVVHYLSGPVEGADFGARPDRNEYPCRGGLALTAASESDPQGPFRSRVTFIGLSCHRDYPVGLCVRPRTATTERYVADAIDRWGRGQRILVARSDERSAHPDAQGAAGHDRIPIRRAHRGLVRGRLARALGLSWRPRMLSSLTPASGRRPRRCCRQGRGRRRRSSVDDKGHGVREGRCPSRRQPFQPCRTRRRWRDLSR